jgi:hypothetical protein
MKMKMKYQQKQIKPNPKTASSHSASKTSSVIAIGTEVPAVSASKTLYEFSLFRALALQH